MLEAIRADLGLRVRVERDLQDLKRRAEDLIRRQHTAVVAVATALVERRHLSEDAVRLSEDAVREIFEANVAGSRKRGERQLVVYCNFAKIESRIDTDQTNAGSVTKSFRRIGNQTKRAPLGVEATVVT